MIIYNLKNINQYQETQSIIVKSKIKGKNKKPEYILLNENGLKFELSDGNEIHIHKGFVWDGSSVPRMFWSLMGPDGDFEVAALIHDYLYEYQKNFHYSEKFVDNEMLKWSKQVNGTNKISIRNIDNITRFIAVRLFGWFMWIKH